ncbi:hypothetical protein ACKI1I_20460 [Streptomyces turgidiscabies]|nr:MULTISPECIES: hypothetical protein [Streptomyces]MDX3496704.1 hypothetical protein [Streptomyces turgidiscabies]
MERAGIAALTRAGEARSRVVEDEADQAKEVEAAPAADPRRQQHQ